VPAALRARLGDDATFGLIEVFDSERKDWSEHVLSVAADRFERRLTEEVTALRVEVRNALHDGLRSVRQELATTRVEALKWSFVFWVGQVAAIAGLLAFMLRHP
jgi:regulation of enolase protein 1 (concanavalin A-like superfamily)